MSGLAVLTLVAAWILILAAMAWSPAPGQPGSLFAVPPIALRLLAGRAAPTALAVCLALLSLPIVALSLDVVSVTPGVYLGTDPTRLSPMELARWSSAAGAVLAAGLVAGTLGGFLVRSHAKSGAALTFVLAWQIGIAALPIVPALLHTNTGFAYFCIDGCSAALDSRNPGTGLQAALIPFALLLSPLLAPVAFAALSVGVVAWTKLLRGSRRVMKQVTASPSTPHATGIEDRG